MQIKRFEAKDMAEALRMVKKEFGANAVILSAKTQKKTNRFLGTSKQAGVVITAATDQYAAQAAEQQVSETRAVASGAGSAGFRPLYNNYGITTRPVSNGDQTVDNRDTMDTRKELPARVHTVPRMGVKKALNLFKGRLLSQGIESALAKEMVNEMESVLSETATPDAGEMRALFEELLESKSLIADPLELKIKKRRTLHVVALVGPTGMGKTTSVVKLAIKHQMEMQHRVGILSLDHYRIGATAALQTYAQVAQIPFELVSDAAGVNQALENMRDLDIVFIDTPGMGLQDLMELDDLIELLDAAAPDEVHLALSASIKDGDMTAYTRHFEPLHLNRILFTKIDESHTHGNMINLLVKSGLQAAYLTAGQRVPEDVSSANVKRLSDLILPKMEAVMENGMGKGAVSPASHDRRSGIPRQRPYYVANRNSDIFHHHQCKSVKRIHEDNVVYFENMEEAVDKKFKPCRMCCIASRDVKNISRPRTGAAYGRY